jgi:DsbC/DsbD-like thiol-disulfide interchange protein
MRYLAIPILLLVIAPAGGAETAWQEIAPGVQLRMISSGEFDATGATLAGIEIRMPANTRTYWRVPGETGFPLQLELSANGAPISHAIHWPYPTRLEKAEYLDYAYLGDVVLPIEIQAAPGTMLSADLVLGICSDICIPAQASFLLPLNSQDDTANRLRLRQAQALAPLRWNEAAAPFGSVQHHAARSLLTIEWLDPAVDPASLIVTAPTGMPLFGTPRQSDTPGMLEIAIIGDTSDLSPGDQLTLTFLTNSGAYELIRPLAGVVGH